jgi:hypothetical protein
MSRYTRHFMENGAAEGEPLEFLVNDLDYDEEEKKAPGLFLVQ